MSDLQNIKQTNASKQAIPSIDLMRVICAIMVVIIHTQSKGGHDVKGYIISQVVPRIAVPFFFMISGYFLSVSLTKKQDIKIIFKYIRRVIVTYTLWSVIYYIISLEYNLRNNVSIVKGTKHFVINFFSIGSSYHLWYFPALILSVFVFAVFYKLKQLNLLIALSVLLYIIGLFGISYYRIGIHIPVLNLLYKSPQFTPISRVFLMGIPFFMLGHMVNTGKEYYNRISNKTSWVIAIAVMASFLLEIVLVRNLRISNGITMTASLYFLTGWSFVLCIKNPLINMVNHSIKLRYISNFTYYAHPLYIKYFDVFLSKIFKLSLTQLPEVFAVCLLTTVTVLIIIKVNKAYLLKFVA